MLNNPKTPIADICRLITAMMAGLIEEMQEPAARLLLKSRRAEIQILRIMTKVLIDTHRLQPWQAELDLEGPEFEAALKFLCSLFFRTLTEAGFNDGLVNISFTILKICSSRRRKI